MSSICCSHFFFYLFSFHPKCSCKDFQSCSSLIYSHLKFKHLFLSFKTLYMSTPGCTRALLTAFCSLQPASSSFITVFFIFWIHWIFFTFYAMTPCRFGKIFWWFQAKFSSSGAFNFFFFIIIIFNSSCYCIGMSGNRVSFFDLMDRGITSTCNFWQPTST